VRPYEGFHQSIFHRVVSGGFYFPLEDLVRQSFPEKHGQLAHSFASGVVSGSVIAVTTNPLAAIKYQSWGTSHRGAMFSTAQEMMLKGGFSVFFRAIHTTIARDFVWGGTFAMLRHYIPRSPAIWGKYRIRDEADSLKPGVVSFTSNLLAGGIATVLSSPINYVRNIQYGRSAAKKTPPSYLVLRRLWNEGKVNFDETGEARIKFLIRRLALGWGTLRVAFGMAFSSQVYGFCSSFVF